MDVRTSIHRQAERDTPTSHDPARSAKRHEVLILAALTLGTSFIAGVLLHRGLTTWLEAISFVTGAVCVWLTVLESIWNFPISMLNVAAFAVVFFRARLVADTGLQVVYFVLSGIGWYLWLHGGSGRQPLRITLAPTRRRWAVGSAAILMWIALLIVLRRLGGASPGWDAITTALSLAAQWLLDRKHLENWLLWILADLIYIPLYLYKQLYLTAGLYAVFLAMAVIGFLSWRRTWLELQRSTP